MDTAALVLIIILAVVLTIFLVVTIILVSLAIKLMKKLKMIADQAEKAVDSVSTAGDVLRNASGPLAIAKLVRNLVKKHNDKK
ncbi:MAG TPA: hypothetical protein VF572_01240 [Candidatus Saccharimonadales bacterium]|jgi:hypothetical protein